MLKTGEQNGEPDLMSSVKNIFSTNGENKEETGDNFIDPKLLGTIMSALTKTNHNNKGATLISALKPYLSGPRQHKADEAIKLLKLLSLLPILKDSGIISSII